MDAVLVLTRRDVVDLLGLDDCISAVEGAFRLHAEGGSLPPGVLSVHAADGGFHIKAAGLRLGRPYFAAKTNGNFPGNPARHGRPAIQGVVVLCDAEHGTPLAVMDSIAITAIRTGAATAVAARHLARPGARVATICGCGAQGDLQLRALARVAALERVFAFDVDAGRAKAFGERLGAELGLDITPVDVLADATRRSDIVVTCTPSRVPLLRPGDLMPGAFLSAVGADSEHKQEVDPRLLAGAALVVDVLEQSATIGELHHALDAGVMTRADVRAELGDVIAGRRPGRLADDEIVIFDSTGTALQDVAAAVAVYERAVATRRGVALPLGT
jgi:ornithine cyclodeaminase/alanine dehydrogenase-like protein (mu-crystallin family)